jgi:nucleoside-diphosphate-sugar epimerase
MKTILVTGATGFLGHHLVQKILNKGDKVIAVLGRPEDKANALPHHDNLIVFPCSALFSTDFGHVDTLIHTAFSRGENMQGLADSVELTERVIELVNYQDIDSFLNISSQGVYKGLNVGEKVSELGTIGPNTSYGLAKWAVENMLRIGCKKPYTNIRMASLSANARFLDFFVNSVIEHKDIIVTAPHQYASIMDVKDAVDGIMSIENKDISNRKNTYNLGPGVQHSILEYAESANKIGMTFGYPSIQVSIDDKGSNFAICMDCSRLMSDTGWKPSILKDEMITKLFAQKCK